MALRRVVRGATRGLSDGYHLSSSSSSSFPYPPPPSHIRRLAMAPGSREKLLLEEDPALKKFKSEKETVKLIKRIGDILVISVVTGSAYEIYYRVQKRKAAEEFASVETH